jgi:hypothetical protein
MNYWYLIVATIWILCGILAYGIMFADSQRRYPLLANDDYREDMANSVLLGLFGPIGLLTALFSSGFARYGLKFR